MEPTFAGSKANGTLAYGQVKLVAALWMASLARRNPKLSSFITMSPGNTSGTDVARDFPLPVRVLMKNRAHADCHAVTGHRAKCAIRGQSATWMRLPMSR